MGVGPAVLAVPVVILVRLQVVIGFSLSANMIDRQFLL